MVKNKNINDIEMLKTFNCGVGFCLIVNKKILKKFKAHLKRFYTLRNWFISNSKKKLNLINKVKMVKKKLVFLYLDQAQILKK